MPDIAHDSNDRPGPAADLSRRDFVALSVAGGLAVAGTAAQAALPVGEAEVTIATPDGSCDAAFIHPATGSYPGVLIWPDAFGLRPAMRAIGIKSTVVPSLYSTVTQRLFCVTLPW